MKKIIGWIGVVLFGMFLLILLPGIWMFGSSWTGGYGGMMGGFYPMHPFGWGWMFLGWLIPVGVIVLLVVGVFGLINGYNRSGQLTHPSVTQSRTCSHCGKPAQAEWNTCPYCGQKLT